MKKLVLVLAASSFAFGIAGSIAEAKKSSGQSATLSPDQRRKLWEQGLKWCRKQTTQMADVSIERRGGKWVAVCYYYQ